MEWIVSPIWKGEDIWILGGGPSVPEQFGVPEDIIDRVIAGALPPSAYSPYMESIHNKHVIGINVAYLIGDWIDMMFFMDSKFFQANSESLKYWLGMKVSCWLGASKIPWIKYLARDAREFGISGNPSTVCWNTNSGCAAISLASHLGAKRIILLGFDMSFGQVGRHWHNLYNNELPSAKHPVLTFNFARHMAGMDQIALDAKARGIEIINASPRSVITQFPKFGVKELLK